MEPMDIAKLESVFNNTTSTYKYFWMLSLIDAVREGTVYKPITFTEMVARMLSKAWMPLKLGFFSFGKCDAMLQRINALIDCSPLCATSLEERVMLFIISNGKSHVVKEIVDAMTKYVPYRFLYPWVGAVSNKKTEEMSQQPAKRTLYIIKGASIIVNPVWAQYFMEHSYILEGFTYHHLELFLEKRNEGFVLPVESSIARTADGSYIVHYENFLHQQAEHAFVASPSLSKQKLVIRNYVNGTYVENQIINSSDDE